METLFDSQAQLRQAYGKTDLPILVKKPWGHEVIWACTDQYVGKIIHVKRGHKLSLQYHLYKDESSYLLSGRMKLVKGNSIDELAPKEINPGHTWRNVPGEIHTIEALEDSEVLEVSTTHLADVVRLEDNYGRAGTSVA